MSPLRKYMVTVFIAGTYAFTSTVRNVNTSMTYEISSSAHLPRLLRNFAANAAVVTCVASWCCCIGICAPSMVRIQIKIISICAANGYI